MSFIFNSDTLTEDIADQLKVSDLFVNELKNYVPKVFFHIAVKYFHIITKRIHCSWMQLVMDRLNYDTCKCNIFVTATKKRIERKKRKERMNNVGKRRSYFHVGFIDRLHNVLTVLSKYNPLQCIVIYRNEPITTVPEIKQ